MTHNSRIRSSGGWTAGSTVLSSEFEAFDANQAASINGDAGGSWAPSSAITLTGAGLNVGTGATPAPLTVTGAFTATGNITLGDASTDTLSVAATTTFAHNMTCNGNVTCGGQLNVSSGASMSCVGPFYQYGPATFSSLCQFNNNCLFSGNTSIGSGSAILYYSPTAATLAISATTLAVSGAATFASGISASGSSPVWSIASDGSLACKTVTASGNVTTAGTVTASTGLVAGGVIITQSTMSVGANTTATFSKLINGQLRWLAAQTVSSYAQSLNVTSINCFTFNHNPSDGSTLTLQDANCQEGQLLLIFANEAAMSSSAYVWKIVSGETGIIIANIKGNGLYGHSSLVLLKRSTGQGWTVVGGAF